MALLNAVSACYIDGRESSLHKSDFHDRAKRHAPTSSYHKNSRMTKYARSMDAHGIKFHGGLGIKSVINPVSHESNS